MSVLELLGGLDWWQLGWILAGLFFVLMIAALFAAKGSMKRGIDTGWHERQHWEADELLKGAIQHAFDKKQ